ncbi:MAG TPA: FAD-binding oxidoreductase [Candidatus Limnocylindria bacterium]
MSVDVAVIGGGIIGTSAAAMLAERGLRVTLFEATSMGAGASGRNLGVLQHPFDPVLAPLYHDSMDRYRRLAGEDGGLDLPASPVGLLMLNADADAARAQATRLAAALPELQPSFLDPDAVALAEPSLARGFAACRLETGHPIPPAAATAAWALRAERLGVDPRVGEGAEPVVEGGRVAGVRLSGGEIIPAGSVLVAAGPWTPPLVDATGGWQPIVRTWGVTVQVELDAAPRHVVEQDEVDAVNRPARAAERAAAAGEEAEPESLFSMASAAGVTTLGSTFLPAEPEPEPIARLLLRRGAGYLPALAAAPVVEVRLCARPQSLDGRPFIGPLPWAEGLHVCAGHGPWGISTGPGSAALAVESLVAGSAAGIPGALRADRFPD